MNLKAFARFAIKKVSGAAITLFTIICVSFILFRLAPGDPIRLMFLDPRVPPDEIVGMYERFGLDKTLWQQFIAFLRQLFLYGDLGFSFWQRRPVMNVVAERIPQTLLLTLTALVIAVIMGIIFGAIAGWKTGSKTDVSILSIALILSSIPAFCMGILLLLSFAIGLPLFPIGGRITAASMLTGFAHWRDVLLHLVLPASAVGCLYFGTYVILTRGAMQDVMGQDYITSAMAKGIKESAVLRRHALRNAILPVITLTGVSIAYCIAGTVQIETVFSYPGVGLLLYQSVMNRDYPVLQGAFLVLSIAVVLANLTVDLIYGRIDPRIVIGVGQ